jgi:hypothetical protein
MQSVTAVHNGCRRAAFNEPATQRYLVSGSEAFVGDYYRLQIDKQIFPNRLGLTDELLGKPIQSMREMLADPEDAAMFSDAQHQGSMGPALLLSRRLDLTGYTSLLDVAGTVRAALKDKGRSKR